jgi:hypothetical protein
MPKQTPSPVVQDIAALRTLVHAVAREDLTVPAARSALVELAKDGAFVDLYQAARQALYEEITLAFHRLQVAEAAEVLRPAQRRRRNNPS